MFEKTLNLVYHLGPSSFEFPTSSVKRSVALKTHFENQLRNHTNKRQSVPIYSSSN